MRPERDVKLFCLLFFHGDGNSHVFMTYELLDGTTLLLAAYASVRESAAPARLAGKSTCSLHEETFRLLEGNITVNDAVRLKCGRVAPS